MTILIYYIYITRVITNYAFINKYKLKFFLKEFFSYLCDKYLIKFRNYILGKYKRYRYYWNFKKVFFKYSCFSKKQFKSIFLS